MTNQCATLRSAKTLLLATAVLGFGCARGHADPPAPVGYWPLDEGAAQTAADASGKNNAGMLRGDAAWDPGFVGAHALRLSGTPGSAVEIPTPVVDTSKSYTAMAWVKLRKIGGFQTIISIDGNQISGFFLQLRDDTSGFAFTTLPDDAASPDGRIANAQEAAKPGVWYHVAAVYDAVAHTGTLYVDGVAQETVPMPSAWRAIGNTAIGRGRFDGNPVDWTSGDIDDVRLYQAALTPADVRAAAGPKLPPPAAVAPAGPATLQLNFGQPGVKVSPTLYGLMTEEINYSYDGGLYAELIRNRAFDDSAAVPVHWSMVQDGGTGSMTLDPTQPLNAAHPASLKLTVAGAGGGNRVGVANDGYWGIPVKPDATYRASVYAKAAPGFSGPLAVDIESADGSVVYAKAQIPRLTGGWKQYDVTLKTSAAAPASTGNRFVVSSSTPGTVNLGFVSLFPPTYKNRPNGNRIDLMEKMAAMKPAFLRMPGGNYLEGDTIATRFDWKKTLGPIADRPGHQGPWGYRSTDGMGLLEFLEWCEDLKMEPVLAVFAGYSLRGEHVEPGPALEPFVQDALDEIEYLTGDKNTKWGARRIADGHPGTFPLHYVEVGNEDGFDRSGSYSGRFSQFYRAIKAKYPALQLISTAGGKDPVGVRTSVKGVTPDIIDEHYYVSPSTFESRVHQYDTYDRSGPKIFVGEWASQEGKPTPDMNSALGDAAWMTGMERNSDLIPIESYAPLFVNVNPGGSQWGVNLIGYNNLQSYGSPSYYAQAMFGSMVGDTVVPTTATGDPGKLFWSVTRDSKTGAAYVKLVNASPSARLVHLDLAGIGSVGANGSATVLAGAGPRETNTLADPNRIVPVTTVVTGLGKSFDRILPPFSITVLTVHTR
jgi:alpha-L-arabinofuranosidase